MKKTLGVVFALSLMVIFATGCSNSQVIPVKSNCNKMQGKSMSSSHCKLVNRKGHQYIVHESNGFSFKMPSRWTNHFSYVESDQSENGSTDYTLTLQYKPEKGEKTAPRLDNLMVLRVLDHSQWEALEKSTPAHELLAETDTLVYTAQFPAEKPHDKKSLKKHLVKEMSLDLQEVKENFKLLP